jgi:methionine-gamma-lyase
MHEAGDAIVFGSGMAAVSHTFLALVAPGDNVISHPTVYGCTDDFLSNFLPSIGVEVRFADLRNPQLLKYTMDDRTRAVFFETPANPTLDLINIAAIAEKVHGHCPIIVDNTFASPFGQNPFKNGANVVLYSMTKSISGHTNAIGGAVLGSGPFMVHLFVMRKDIGGMLSPREADAFLNGIKTLPLRYKQMQENAIEVALMLRSHPEVANVFYPLFDPRYASLSEQMSGPGHMISFILKKGLEGGKTLIDSLQSTVHAVSLGGVESLICHPASTTHSCVPVEERKAKGIDDGLVRLSVGVDSLTDVLADLRQALDKVAKL